VGLIVAGPMPGTRSIVGRAIALVKNPSLGLTIAGSFLHKHRFISSVKVMILYAPGPGMSFFNSTLRNRLSLVSNGACSGGWVEIPGFNGFVNSFSFRLVGKYAAAPGPS